MPAVLRTIIALIAALSTAPRSRADLLLENAALRAQIATLLRMNPHVRTCPTERLFWVALRSVWSGWKSALLIVQPDTVVAWHRMLFAGYWRWKSRPRGRPRKEKEIRELIATMATQNPWGAPHIHGELRKLGFRVSERTVSRILRELPPRGESNGRNGQNWKTFLENHRDAIVAMDLFTVPTITFSLLYVMVLLHHDRRRVLHFAVTRHPTAAWAAAQVHQAFLPLGKKKRPKFLLCDNDSIFGTEVEQTAETLGIEVKRTGFQSPWQNGICERFIGTCRRELLDHVIVFHPGHLRRLMTKFLAFYHEDRTHLGLEKDAPNRRAVTPRPSPAAKVVSLPRVGGLHHRYAWREAA